MNKFEKYAYLYSAWVSMAVPLILSIYICYDNIDLSVVNIDVVKSVLCKIVPASCLVAFYAGVGFYFRNTFRLTSRLLFQYPLFKEDESDFPTTIFLLYGDDTLPDETKDAIRQKVLDRFKYKMKNKDEEQTDLKNAKKCIVQAVGYMRNVTREDPILLQSNYKYGFQRNQMGGLVWALLFCIVIITISLCSQFNYLSESLISMAFIILQGVIAYFMMKHEAKAYARTLITSFLSC